MRITNIIKGNLNKSRLTVAIFLDVAKAFDRVWHKGLTYKMIKLNIPLCSAKIINLYINKKKFYTGVNDETSVVKTIKVGVSQGLIFSPLRLHNQYTSDIAKD